MAIVEYHVGNTSSFGNPPLAEPGTTVLQAGNIVAARAVLVSRVVSSTEDAARDLPS